MDKCSIPVAWGADEKYILPAFVVMHSILAHSDYKYHFYILTTDQIERQVEGYTKRLKRVYNNFSVSVRYIKKELFAEAKVFKEHLSIAAYYRLLLPEILNRYDKCIYLDCDVLVNGDLKELYNIDLGDDYLAGVKDCHIIEDTSFQREHEKALGIPSRDKYINSGMMLMNLKKLREDGMVSRFWAQMKRENWYEDQDILNYCCYPYIKILPIMYNLFHFYCGKSIRRLWHLDYPKEDFEFIEPFIVHMGAKWKPWFSRKVKYADEWWKLALVYRDSEYYDMYHELCQKDEYETMVAILETNQSRSIVICGYTRFGICICNMAYAKGFKNIAAFADNDRKKWTEQYRGIPVMGIEQAYSMYKDVLWIVTNQHAFEPIRQQLTGFGVRNQDIIRYIDYFADPMYLLSMDEKFYDLEIEKIADFEFPEDIDRKEHVIKIMDNPSLFPEEYEYLKKRYCFQYWCHVGNGESQ